MNRVVSIFLLPFLLAVGAARGEENQRGAQPTDGPIFNALEFFATHPEAVSEAREKTLKSMDEARRALDAAKSHEAALESRRVQIDSLLKEVGDLSAKLESLKGELSPGAKQDSFGDSQKIGLLEIIRSEFDPSGGHNSPAVSAVVILSDAELREKRWAFQPVTKPGLPDVRDVAWATGAIDRFVLAKLEAAGLKPSAPADRRALIRRLSFDLLGLPPSVEEVESFIADKSVDAYERLVDRMLASPRYGERQARHWLDVVRFAETDGFETNTPRPNAWPYRDYVIRAFNEDKPYNQFIVEQLAGDSTGEDAATGFLVGGAYDTVKSPDVVLTKQQRMDELHDMISTTSGAFLGLTVGCARCHDHKFDPITQKDYYSMQAIFAGVEHGDRDMREPGKEERMKKAGEVRAELAALQAKLARFEPLANNESSQRGVPVAAGSGELNARPETIERPLRAAVSPRMNVDRFAPVEARFVRFTILGTNNLEPCIDELEIMSVGERPRNVALASEGAKASASGTFPNADIHKQEHINDGLYGNSHSWISNEIGKGWVQIELASPTKIDRVNWARDREGNFKDRLATGYKIEVALNPGEWRVVASSADRRPYVEGSKARRYAGLHLSPDETEDLIGLLLVSARQEARLRELEASPKVYAGRFTQPCPTHRLYRGDAMQPKEEVAPDAIATLGRPLNLQQEASERERRMALARWITDPQNPLPARVMANRIWQSLFGGGIVATPSDFGANGARPSHPELLDWLAIKFVEDGWSVKKLVREIVLSNTYQQSSAPRPDALAVDAGDRLLWRYSPRRLEAEPIRDSILFASGKLDLAVGGPGYNVFEPNDNYVRVYSPKEKFGPAEWRRMIYQYKPRMEQDETFGIFDCPDAGQTTPKRTNSTTPLQALNLLNSRFMLQQSDFLAERLKREAGADQLAQARRAFVLAFDRDPAPDEAEASAKFIAADGLPAFCRAIFNANEFIYVN